MSSVKTKTLNLLRKPLTFSWAEKTLLYFVRGTEYLGFWSRLIPGPQLYQKGSIRRVKRGGIDFELDISCLMQWYIYWDLSHVTRVNLYDLVKKGFVIFDVGTNVGETLLNFAELTGEGGFVYGFEPDEKNFRGVKKNIALNNFSNVYVFNSGISDKKETLKLYRVDEHNLGMNRVLRDEDETGGLDFTEIETTTLDDIVKENGISQLDLIKIDIEGYEMHALRGAGEILRRFRPILFIEVGYSRLIKNGTSPNEMIGFLEDFDYRIYHAETLERITGDYDFSYLGDGGIDVIARVESRSASNEKQ
ncbi:MAG: FkbM family methyltransferase [Pyrinomonadaceae bacterium]